MNKKLLTATLIAGAMSISTLGAFAESGDTIECATQIIQAELKEFISITPKDCGTTPLIDTDTGHLDGDLKSEFDVKLNYSPNLRLSASVVSDTGEETAFFQKGSGDDVYIVLAHVDNKPTTSAIANIISGTTSAPSNSNVIAYPISLDLDGPISTPNFSDNIYTFSGAPGESTVTTNIGQAVFADSYDLTDSAGTYQAVVKLCAVTP